MLRAVCEIVFISAICWVLLLFFWSAKIETHPYWFPYLLEERRAVSYTVLLHWRVENNVAFTFINLVFNCHKEHLLSITVKCQVISHYHTPYLIWRIMLRWRWCRCYVEGWCVEDWALKTAWRLRLEDCIIFYAEDCSYVETCVESACVNAGCVELRGDLRGNLCEYWSCYLCERWYPPFEAAIWDLKRRCRGTLIFWSEP